MNNRIKSMLLGLAIVLSIILSISIIIGFIGWLLKFSFWYSFFMGIPIFCIGIILWVRYSIKIKNFFF